MDKIAKSIESKFELGLSDEQSNRIDAIFREFMREYHFPKSQPINDSLLRFKYFREGLSVLSKDQINIYRIKKLQERSKNKIEERVKEERQLNHLKVEYKDVNLTASQVEIVYKTKNSFRKQIIELEQKHLRIYAALENTLGENQRNELEKLFTYQLKRDRIRKAESTKYKYRYLNLRDDQAKEISIFEEIEKKQLKENGYKEYDLYEIKQNFKDILTSHQFDLYSEHQEQQKEKSLQSKIKSDANISDKFADLEKRINFQIQNILPPKCRIVKQLRMSASNEDLLRIEKLKNRYDKVIEELISKKKNSHLKKYGSQLPNQLKMSIIESTLLDINPSPSLLLNLDLETSEFTTIQLNEIQEAELEALKLKQREYHIKNLEAKLKGSYAPLISSGRKNVKPKYFELYGILLLDGETQKNIDKMKMRQITHGVS